MGTHIDGQTRNETDSLAVRTSILSHTHIHAYLSVDMSGCVYAYALYSLLGPGAQGRHNKQASKAMHTDQVPAAKPAPFPHRCSWWILGRSCVVLGGPELCVVPFGSEVSQGALNRFLASNGGGLMGGRTLPNIWRGRMFFGWDFTRPEAMLALASPNSCSAIHRYVSMCR